MHEVDAGGPQTSRADVAAHRRKAHVQRLAKVIFLRLRVTETPCQPSAAGTRAPASTPPGTSGWRGEEESRPPRDACPGIPPC